MQYRLDISNSYPRLLIFSGEQGFTTYMSTPSLNISDNKDFEILFDNIEVNFLEDIWYLPVINSNKNSIIASVINNIDLTDLSSMLTLNLRRAKIIIKDVKNLYMKIENNDQVYFHNQNFTFNVGDKKIWLTGKSMDFFNTLITTGLIFSGGVDFIFDESDIIIKSIDFDEFISLNDIKSVDQAQNIIVNLKNRKILDLKINGERSNFLDFSFSQEYFSNDEHCSLAIKEYKPY